MPTPGLSETPRRALAKHELQAADRERNLLSFYGPYHLFHNTTNGIILGSGGAGWQGKCLNTEILRAAAEAPGCDLAKRIAYQTAAKHAHMATSFFMPHSGMND